MNEQNYQNYQGNLSREAYRSLKSILENYSMSDVFFALEHMGADYFYTTCVKKIARDVLNPHESRIIGQRNTMGRMEIERRKEK